MFEAAIWVAAVTLILFWAWGEWNAHPPAVPRENGDVGAPWIEVATATWADGVAIVESECGLTEAERAALVRVAETVPAERVVMSAALFSVERGIALPTIVDGRVVLDSIDGRGYRFEYPDAEPGDTDAILDGLASILADDRGPAE
jgi:hypothetical protein